MGRILALGMVMSLLSPLMAQQPAANTDPPIRRTGHVVLVDWDGFDPSYLGRVPMPHYEALRRRGSRSIATATYRAISNPSRASMATGAHPATHHNAAYVYDPVTNTVIGQNRRIDA
jgi:hypothetical protein